MANLTYLTLNGQTQRLISGGCSSMDSIGNKAQIGRIDQIMVYSMKHTLSRAQNVNHHVVTLLKPIDKSTPLLGKAISDNEIMTCDLELHRINKTGMGECYFKVKLTGARVTNIDFIVPHSILESNAEAQERVSFSYETITWEHCIAGTSAYSLWNERVY